MLVGVKSLGIAFIRREGNRDHFACEETGGVRRDPALLRPESEGVLIGAADMEVLRHVFSRLRHGIGAVPDLHERVHKAPDDGGIEDLFIAYPLWGEAKWNRLCHWPSGDMCVWLLILNEVLEGISRAALRYGICIPVRRVPGVFSV